MDKYKTINFKSLVIFILKKLWVIALAALIFGIAALLITSYAITPMYRATIRLYACSEVPASKLLADTYISIIESDSVVEELVERGKYGYTDKQIVKMLDAKPINNTDVFEVSVTGPMPEECANIANSIADIAPDKISEIIEGSSVKIIDRAKTPSEPVSPNIPGDVAAAVLIGITISGALLFFIFVSDTTIYSEEDIREFCTLSILGVLPDFNQVYQGRGNYSYSYGGRNYKK